MNNFVSISSELLKENVYKTKLDNGLEIYICKKEGYKRKIGMFGTKYGSLHNDFIDIETGERINVPDGVAHYLEHKLFEQEGENALDLFSKEGISSNAYTSFDHTVYYFETIDKFEKALEMLIKLVKTPYFTDENVEKERGIIGQEISMYDDDPSFRVYFEALKNMYHVNPVNIDIAGTIESISHITKEILYKCYNTFYNLNNMFIVIIGDVDIESTIALINSSLEKYSKNADRKEIIKYTENEPEFVVRGFSDVDMKLSMPQVNIGFKLSLALNNEMVKQDILANVVSEMYLSKTSEFFEKMYKENKVEDEIGLFFEGAKEFSHILVMFQSKTPISTAKEIGEYLVNLKNTNIDENLLDITKKKIFGSFILRSEDPNNCYRRIIDSIINDSDLYYNLEFLNSITKEDIYDFLNNITEENMTISIVK